VFGLALALGAGGLITASGAVITAIASLHAGAHGSRRLVVAGLRFTYPAVDGAGAVLFAIAALGTVAVAMAGRACWRQRRRYLRMVAQMRPATPLARDPRVKVIADRHPQAFCAGYLRPVVYMSEPTIDLLSDAELSAVLAHEHHHRRVRDPLRLACVRILGEALFFVPALTRLSERYADLAELSADRAAVLASGEAALASALLAFEESGPPGTTGISPERVDSLLGQPVRRRLPVGLLAQSLGTLVLLVSLIWGASGSASVHATFTVPILSSQPCVVMSTSLPFIGCVRIVVRKARRRKLSARVTVR
jgi:Zn-dependent protease with chaperone function